MTPLYPLRFRPILKRAVWGGRRLAGLLGKQLGDGDDFAESWEVVDRGEDQSLVANGPLAGTSVGDLVRGRGDELIGRGAIESLRSTGGEPVRFPLLFKFLDCNRSLSVQVHPDDAYAARMSPPDLGKTEAWVVLHAEPGSRIYAGIQTGLDRAGLEQAIRNGTTERCLHSFEPRSGDCVFIPAGTIHALGEGLVVAEIQQSSDTTFRLFDWNRLGSDGRPRTLHIEKALEVMDFSTGPVAPQTPCPGDRAGVERLAACDKFVLERITIACGRSDRGPNDGTSHGPHSHQMIMGGDERFHIIAVVGGKVRFQYDRGELPTIDLAADLSSQDILTPGETLLLPACSPPLALSADGDATLLDMYLPDV